MLSDDFAVGIFIVYEASLVMDAGAVVSASIHNR